MVSTTDTVPGGDSVSPTGVPAPHRNATDLIAVGIFAQNVILLVCGSSLLSLFVLTVMESGCYYLMVRYGAEDINCAIIFAVSLAHLIIASFIKIALLQSLDENLIIPGLTEFIVLLFFLSMVAAFFAARRLPILRFEAYQEPNAETLEWLALFSTVLMVLPLVRGSGADTAGAGDVGGGLSNFVGVATRGFPTVAIVAAVLRALKKSNNTRVIDVWSGTVLAISIIMGLASNSREGLLAPILAAFATPLYYGYRFSRRVVALLVLFGLFVAFVLSPAILIVRNDRDYLSFTERIEETVETAGLLIIRDPATVDQASTPLDFLNYTVWGRYFGRPVPFADRIGLIQTTDALTAAAYGGNYIAIEQSFGQMMAGLFPDFVLKWFDVQLERIGSSTDYVAGRLGLVDANSASYLSIPVDAEAYAAGGLWSVIYQTFLVFLLVFYVNRLSIAGKPADSVLPLSLLLLGYHVCSEADAGSLVYYALRVVPQFVISFSFVYWISRILGSTSSRGMLKL
jgi:hypothetical protein